MACILKHFKGKTFIHSNFGTPNKVSNKNNAYANNALDKFKINRQVNLCRKMGGWQRAEISKLA